MFFLVVLAHTDEQYNNLLNTRELIVCIDEAIIFMRELAQLDGETKEDGTMFVLKLGL